MLLTSRRISSAPLFLAAVLWLANDGSTTAGDYSRHEIQGWTVHVSDELRADAPAEVTRGLEIIDEQLRRLMEVVPADKVQRLQAVPLWLSVPYPNFGPTAEYHPSAGWLEANGRSRNLARGVEFTNVAILEAENKRMPMLLLHELAHAYHDQVLQFNHPEVVEAYERAKASGTYDAVKRHNGRIEKAYAMSNAKEYFAECTEAYFGRNDFYPFSNGELLAHDPEMHALLEKLWRGEN